MQLISAQLTATTTALRSVLNMEYPADSVLRRYFRENHLLGANDRAFVAETVFGILRHKYYLECLNIGLEGTVNITNHGILFIHEYI